MSSTPQHASRIDYPAPDPAKPYVYPGTPVLINLFDIRSLDVLDRVVETVAGLRGEQLATAPVAGGFDLGHLCAIHRVLFRDVFAWAGQVRTVDTERQGQDFVPAAQIAARCADIHAALQADGFLRGLDPESFADRLADYYYSLYAVHPFRDGNSRTLRHFCADLAAAAGYRLQYAAIERTALLAACRQRYFKDDSGPLRDCVRQISVPR
ncbi:MAG: Fic family protein [Sulfuritalea sp.]|nr:Fic family protein [Sulfuritalea sp.]